MDLEEMLRRATADLERAESEFRAAQERMEAARSHMDELRSMRDGAKMLAERYGQEERGARGTAPERPPAVRMMGGGGGAVTVGGLSQTDLCAQVLRDFGTSATTQQVHERLLSTGHALELDQVRSALGYLVRKKRAVHVGPATWRLAVTDFAPAAGTTGANGAGRDSYATQVRDVPARADLPHSQ